MSGLRLEGYFWLVFVVPVLSSCVEAGAGLASDVGVASDSLRSSASTNEAWASAVESLYRGRSVFDLDSEPPAYLDWDNDLLAEWMMPYDASSEREAAAEEMAEQLLAVGADGGDALLNSSFSAERWDTFFRGRLAKYMGDMLAMSDHGNDMVDVMIDRPCFIVIDEFGELTNENPPFEEARVAAGFANGVEMEVVTTVPVWMVTHDTESAGADLPIPVWLLPLYERYLVQHELGHMVDFNLGETIEIGGETLSSRITELYLVARRDDLHTSCYGSDSEEEFWAEGSALYHAPLPIVSLNSSETDPSCGVGLTAAAEAVVLENGFLRMTGAELIQEMHRDFYNLLEAFYGEPPEFGLREDRNDRGDSHRETPLVRIPRRVTR